MSDERYAARAENARSAPASNAKGELLAACPFCGSALGPFLTGDTPPTEDDDEGIDDWVQGFQVICGDCTGGASWCPSEAEAIAAWNRRVVPLPSPSDAVGAVLTGEELMDEMDAFVAGCGGNPLVAKAIRDAFEGRGLSRDKGVLVHAVRNDLKVEAVTMYRRVEPKQTPKSKAGGTA